MLCCSRAVRKQRPRRLSIRLGVFRVEVAPTKVPPILGEACLAALTALRVVSLTSATTAVPLLSAAKPYPADQCATVWQARP